MIGDLADLMLIPERTLRKIFKDTGAKQVDAQKENPAELVPRICVMELVAKRNDRVSRMLSNLL
jgi:hypothetical protein